jgi:[acyl-carrier-protein] S-malonyltransferase
MIAFLFPGQGSQEPGMGRPWRDHPSWDLVAEGSEAAGRDLSRLLLDAGSDELTETHNAQLATYLLSMVVLDALERVGIEPSLLAGHSVGEYAALTGAGAFDFDDGVRLVAERGEAMRVAADEEPGAMLRVLGLGDDKAALACTRAGGPVWVANYNAPGDVVIAGTPAALTTATKLARELGATDVQPLAVGGAFHSPFMAPAHDRLAKALRTIDLRALDVPVIANVDSRPHQEPSRWIELLLAQLVSPVRWRAGLHRLARQGVRTFVELGSGTSLTGTVHRTIEGVNAWSVASPDELDQLVERLRGAPAPGPHEGEHVFMTERVVVSPAAGIFAPAPGMDPGSVIAVGGLLGTVSGTEVRSPFPGRIEGLLAHAGERLTARQPVAWLRVA